MIAASKGHTEIVKLLLEAKASVNHTEKVRVQVFCCLFSITCFQDHGWSALFFAAKKGHLDIMKLLLKYEADVSLKAKVYKNNAGVFIRVVSFDSDILELCHCLRCCQY